MHSTKHNCTSSREDHKNARKSKENGHNPNEEDQFALVHFSQLKGKHENGQKTTENVNADTESTLIKEVAPKKTTTSVENGRNGAHKCKEVVIANEGLPECFVEYIDILHTLTDECKH